MKFKIYSIISQLKLTPACLATSMTILLCSCSDSGGRDSFKEKSEWATLQTIELKQRNEQITSPIFEVVQDREVLGLQGHSGENVWILLNPQAPPYYKQMPGDVNYEIPKRLYDKLTSEKRVGYTTSRVLYSRIVNDLNKKIANQQVDPIVTTPVDKVEAQGTQGHP